MNGVFNMSEEMIILNNFDSSQVPDVISGQYEKIVELEEKVKASVSKAEQAKKSAKKAAELEVHWYSNKKNAIELLQDAVLDNSKSQISLAEAQEKLFEYQTKLSEITKYLFALGTSNIAMNRSVVREIELKLMGASSEEISQLAKEELRTVIAQLKAQEDIMTKQEALTKKTKEHASRLGILDRQMGEFEDAQKDQGEQIEKNISKISEHDDRLKDQMKKDEEIERRLEGQEAYDEEQQRRIDENSELLGEHRKLIESQEKKDEEIERRLENQEAYDEEQQRRIDQNSELLSEHESLIETQKRKQDDSEKRVAELKSQLELEANALRKEADENFGNLNAAVSSLEEKINGMISELRAEADQSNDEHKKKLENTADELKQIIEQLKNEVSANKIATDSKAEELESRINVLSDAMSKKGWKIAVTVVAATSLLLNILQIFGII